MIVLNGKYTHAKIFLPKDYKEDGSTEYKFLDRATESQILGFLEHPAFAGRKVRVMPDTHAGKGSCVGFTMDFGDAIIPNIVGVDIGCGIRTVKLPVNLMTEDDFREFDNTIRCEVPSGFSIHQESNRDLLDSMLYLEVSELCDELELDEERVMRSVGTLGGGNHFIELGRDTEGSYWLTIHSGSRNFGLRVANFFQSIADESCRRYFVDYGELNFIPMGTPAFDGYLNAMRIAQEYAAANRKAMMDSVLLDFFGEIYEEGVIDSVHNFISQKDGIIRKGATSAHAGEKLVIPFNMEDGLIIATGKGNPEWNNSAPHGAGRILSRSGAKKVLSLEEAKAGMDAAGIFTTSLSKDTLDEAKGAYKSKELITEMIQDTVTIDTWVKPVYNFKAGKE
jgi:tRNA-splicing ligase RtcB (3'-phosphate/5'-hydroxy nucleic acid ligase)